MKNHIFGIMLAMLVIVSAVAALTLGDRGTSASAIVGNDYKTTEATSSGITLIKPATGSFGSVVIASSSAFRFSVYDLASTTGTSTANRVASFPANAAAGTYVFDREINQGIVIDAGPGFNGSYVVTWR